MKKLYFLITLAILVISCEKEEINTKFLNEVATHPVELLKYTQLPPEIHEHLDIINNAASQKGEQIFGNIDKRIVIKRIKSGKDFSYTFSLLKIELAKNQLNNYYFDNLVFKDNKNSNPIVIRYIPTIEWQEGERDIRKFSGQIVFYTLEGKKINQIEVENGMQVASDEKQVCHYTLESVVLQCYGGEGSMLDQPYKCYKIYTYKESCTSGGSPGDGGGGTGTGPGDPPSIPSEPTEGWEPGGSNGGGITDPTIQDPKCQTTLEDVKKVFPNTNENILRTITALINIYGKDFGIDTEEKMQHFLAQAGHESTNYAGTEFSAFEENLNYRIANLGIKDFGLYFNPVTNPTENPAKANPND